MNVAAKTIRNYNISKGYFTEQVCFQAQKYIKTSFQKDSYSLTSDDKKGIPKAYRESEAKIK